MFVYPPSEDTFLLLEACKKLCKGKKVLEIGAGTGVISEEISKIAKEVVCTDINPKAVEICRKKGLKCILSDLFEKINEKFDVIIFNPPYLPEDEGIKDFWVKKAIIGGKKGNETIIRFLREAKKYLKRNGFILFIISSLSNPEEVFEKFKNDYNFKIISKRKLFFEKIYCVRADPV